MTMTRAQRRSRVAGIAVLLAPFVAVQLGRTIGGGVPAPAAAGTPVASPGAGIAVTAPKPVTERQRSAMEWSIAHPEPRSRRSPIGVPSAPPPPPPALEVVAPLTLPINGGSPGEAVFFSIHLNAVMGSGDTAIAVVNGKLYRAGEEVAEGWWLSEIDARRRLVILRGSDGQMRARELGE